jgi:hypothetical protein
MLNRRVRLALFVTLVALMGPMAGPSRGAESLRLVAAIEWLGDVQAPARVRVRKPRPRFNATSYVGPNFSSGRTCTTPHSSHFPLIDVQLPPPAFAS